LGEREAIDSAARHGGKTRTEFPNPTGHTSLLANGFPPGVAADDCLALRFDGTELAEVVSARPGARAYRVTPEGEEPIEPRRLG
jgi:hypothetical protein